MKHLIHVDRHGVTHLASFFGEQYVIGGTTKASIYSTYCGDKLIEAEVTKEGKVTCLTCLGRETT